MEIIAMMLIVMFFSFGFGYYVKEVGINNVFDIDVDISSKYHKLENMIFGEKNNTENKILQIDDFRTKKGVYGNRHQQNK